MERLWARRHSPAVQLGGARVAAHNASWHHGEHSRVHGRLHGEAATERHQLLPVVPGHHRPTRIGHRHALQHRPPVHW